MKTLLLVTILISLTGCAADVSATIMPTGFENIHIGMEWEKFLKARPNVVVGNLGPEPDEIPDPKKPKEGLMEAHDSGPLKIALYMFKDGRLSGTYFVFRFDNNFSDDLLKNVLEKHGDYNEISSSKDIKYASIKWVVDEMCIYLSVPMKDSGNEGQVIGYHIMDMNLVREFETIRADRLKGMSIDEAGLRSVESKIQELSHL